MNFQYTTHISSYGSHFLTAGFLGNQTYRVVKIGYGRMKVEATTYYKNTAHISSNERRYLTAGFLVY